MSQDTNQSLLSNSEVFNQIELPEELPSILNQLGRYQTETTEEDAEGAAEISAFDPESNSLFVVNGVENSIDIIDLSDLKLIHI